MITLYSHGNKETDFLSTPESRSGDVKDKDLVQGLTLLSIKFNKTQIKKLIKLGSKRFEKMESVYVRTIDLLDKDVRDNIYMVHFINSDTEQKFLRDNKKLDKKKLNKKKEKFLKEKGLRDLSVSDLTNAKGVLAKELDNVPIRFNKILAGDIPIGSGNNLYVGLPYFKVVLRAPIKVKSNIPLIDKTKKNLTKESVPIYDSL